MKTTTFLDDVVNGYLDTILWVEDDDSGEQLMRQYDRSDFSPESIATAALDCSRFIGDCTRAGIDVTELPYNLRCSEDSFGRTEYTVGECLGHDLYLTRNGHGSGFWDRDELQDDCLGSRLSDIARKMDSQWVHVDGYGVIHIG